MTEKVNPAKAPKLRNNMTKWEWIRREMSRNKIGYLMVAPYYLVFLIFTVVPVFASLFLSLTQFNMLEPPIFIGVDNYIRLLLDDDIFLLACSNTLIFATMTGPVSYLLCLMFAWFINELTPKIRAFVTLIFYAPSISGQVYLIWQTLFSSDQYGWINGTLMKLGITAGPILWFQDKRYIMTLVIVVALWTSLGTSFLSFIAGFQVVDKSLYEAAAVDGIKNRWQELWFITLPNMKPMLLFGAVMSITAAFSVCDIPRNLAGYPSTDYCARTIVTHLFDYAFTRFEMGYASAIATVLFLTMIICNKIIQSFLNRVGH